MISGGSPSHRPWLMLQVVNIVADAGGPAWAMEMILHQAKHMRGWDKTACCYYFFIFLMNGDYGDLASNELDIALSTDPRSDLLTIRFSLNELWLDSKRASKLLPRGRRR